MNGFVSKHVEALKAAKYCNYQLLCLLLLLIIIIIINYDYDYYYY